LVLGVFLRIRGERPHHSRGRPVWNIRRNTRSLLMVSLSQSVEDSGLVFHGDRDFAARLLQRSALEVREVDRFLIYVGCY
jgi:hypothetical protein